MMESGDWTTLGPVAGEIRRRVFILEQQVPQHEEWDGRDDECLHFLVWSGKHAIGTARLLPDGHIGRVAVLKEARGSGIGRELMQFVIDTARQRGHEYLELAAQTQALDFYRRLGFKDFGHDFIDADILHRNMRLILVD
ncbi:Predicted N-acyltransferase, GNAT family [Aidingimonas halophila]|uniref:Predicted N-acyltransferase, GNAT family n=2 Tax=Aidingimonas halophila TaxID=574349 RepID=A0A1H3EN20_9GAMM|nr:GNAT family N-acetyltransferase [Aidingimonas halophila]SDX79339.1 Predicted N-acyltransferase, GNAT family [Aidingimonas halophila]